MSTRTRIAAGALAATLAVGGLGAVAVGAQESGPDRPDRPGRAGILDGLVTDGTLTAEQADAVRARVAERRAERRADEGRADGRARFAGLRAAAEAIGVPPRDLAGRLRDGESLAVVAAAEGVERQVVVDALLAAGEERIEAALAAGRIDEARVTQARERLPEAVERLVDRTR